MKRHKFTKWNKEKVSIYASAALVVGICVVSGMYAQSQSPSRTQILDIETVEEGNLTADPIVQAEGTEIAEVEENLPVTVHTQSSIMVPYEETKGKEQASIDLTGDAELAEVEVFTEVAPVIAESKQDATIHFTGEDGMSWPVMGNVIMNYSMDERTYFATLNQYCYYPAVAIGSEVDAPVAAAALGVVTKVGINEEIGQYVITDLGDGYQATYGQLKELAVETGDKVSRGQIIGYVAEPTKYYSLEGTNVYFKLEKDGTPINPLNYFR